MITLGRWGRAWRGALFGLLCAGLALGALVGDDHWWPLGPWRMYATSQATTGSIWSTGIEVRLASDPERWQPAPLSPANVGLNRAEVEGRIPLITSRPEVLGTLARSHAELRPDSDPWVGLRVVRHHIVVVDGQVTGEDEAEVLAEWAAP